MQHGREMTLQQMERPDIDQLWLTRAIPSRMLPPASNKPAPSGSRQRPSLTRQLLGDEILALALHGT